MPARMECPAAAVSERSSVGRGWRAGCRAPARARRRPSRAARGRRRRGRAAGRPRPWRRRGRRRPRRPRRPTPSSRSAAAIGPSQLWKAAVAAAASSASSGRASAAAATGQPSRSGWSATRRRKISPNIASVCLQPALLQRALDQVADRRPLQFGRLERELGLAAGEVVVDRAARSLAARGDVAQLHPRVALLGQQLPGAVEQQRAAVAALALDRLPIGDSRYAHGHSLCCGGDV